MDRQIDIWIDRLLDGLIDYQMGRQIVMDTQIIRCIDRFIDRQTDKLLDGQIGYYY